MPNFMLRSCTLVVTGLFAVFALSACGKESAPVYKDVQGNTPPAFSYPPAYDEQVR